MTWAQRLFVVLMVLGGVALVVLMGVEPAPVVRKLRAQLDRQGVPYTSVVCDPELAYDEYLCRVRTQGRDDYYTCPMGVRFCIPLSLRERRPSY